MPKSLDKTKGALKRKKPPNTSGNTESDTSESKACPKKKKVQRKRNGLVGIEMSKQLASQIQQKKLNRGNTCSKKNSEPRLCGNGTVMPSLAELEAMYDDSDEDETQPSRTDNLPKNERCETPEQKPLLTDNVNMNSPETLKKITSEVIDLISKTINLDDDDSPPPVIPQKKPKKSDIPYIVGCKKRPQVPWAPKSKFGVDNKEYGIDPNQTSDEDDKKRKKRGKKVNLSKSIFNAQSDEIAERLKELEKDEPLRPDSPDSDKTLDYSPKLPRSFSPLPSTSKDKKIILRNDELFNESLNIEILPTEHSLNNLNSLDEQRSPNEIEIIEVPCETIVVDDMTDTDIKAEKRSSPKFDDDCCIIVEPEAKKKRISNSPVQVDSSSKDEIYGSIDLTQSFDNEVYVIDDDEIDNLMAENKALLEKDVQNNIASVTFVDPNIITIESETPSHEVSCPNQSIKRNTSSSPNQSNTDESSFPSVIRTAVDLVNNENEENFTVNNSTVPSPQVSKTNEIAEVVNNFFTQQSSDGIISEIKLDYTKSPESMMNRITSWICSLEAYFRGRQKTNNSNLTADNYVPQTIQNSNSQNMLQHSQLMHNRGSIDVMPRCRRRRSQSRLTNFPHPPTQSEIVPLAQPVQNPVTTPSQPSPPRRSLSDCPICMDSLASTTVASTLCGHVFCMACIKAAIRANGKKCPTCRKSLKGLGYHQLFL